MVAITYMRVMDRKVTIILLIYTGEASKKDQAPVKDIRKKDIINNIILITMVEPLKW